MDDLRGRPAARAEDLRGRLAGAVHLPGEPGYAAATSPRNATAAESPAAVAAVAGAADVATCLRWAGSAGLSVAVQATGHGAGRDVGASTLLLDTSGLDEVTVDPERRIVRAGAGATLAAVNAAAWQHGLLALAGTAPDVGVVGYTAHGGVGWLTRPHGLASASLLAVDLVDGRGEVRRADDTTDDVLWAYRGGGGVGVATAVELRLYPADELVAGYLLWPADAAEEVVPAWGRALRHLHPALSSVVGLLLHAPDAPTVPEDLRGQPVVHLSAASVAGEDGLRALREVLSALPPPAIDTLGPCDAQRLTTIHLDPPAAVPAVGEGRWLTAGAGERALEVLTAGAGGGSPLAEIELRHVAAPASDVPGALTSCPGDVLLHATGPAPDPDAERAVRATLQAVLAAARPVDTGRSAASFRDGQRDAPGDLTPDARRRLAAVRDEVDPAGLLRAARPLT